MLLKSHLNNQKYPVIKLNRYKAKYLDDLFYASSKQQFLMAIFKSNKADRPYQTEWAGHINERNLISKHTGL